ncbi:MAG: DUF4238 domain-containing protein [Chloroflexi bacterium]|nr:DUF4238 domain-containing protein [Chloroflexota bacterium]
MTKNHESKNNPSKKHHYLPRHYLNGFTNSDRSFFVFDKKRDKIFSTSTDDFFFQNNLNTVTLPDGSSSDFLEDLYTDLENRCWRSIDTIRGSTHKTPIQPLDKMHLFLFIVYLYWRLPSNIQFVAKLSEKAFLDNDDFDYFRLMTKSGVKAPPEIADRLKNSSAFKKFFRLVVPLVPLFKDENWAIKLENWRFLYTGDDKVWDIVGDNPIIVRENVDSDIVYRFREFVFPVSGKILLINIGQPPQKDLPPEFTVQFNAAVIENAQRFAACQNREFLEALVKYYKMHIQFGKTTTIIPEMFRMLGQ